MGTTDGPARVVSEAIARFGGLDALVSNAGVNRPGSLLDYSVEDWDRLFARDRGITTSHQFAIEAHDFGGGQSMAKLLRRANILACGIGLPLPEIDGDVNGLRMGTPELVRWGMSSRHMRKLAGFIADVLRARKTPEAVAADVTAYRREFSKLHYLR